MSGGDRGVKFFKTSEAGGQGWVSAFLGGGQTPLSRQRACLGSPPKLNCRVLPLKSVEASLIHKLVYLSELQNENEFSASQFFE